MELSSLRLGAALRISLRRSSGGTGSYQTRTLRNPLACTLPVTRRASRIGHWHLWSK